MAQWTINEIIFFRPFACGGGTFKSKGGWIINRAGYSAKTNEGQSNLKRLFDTLCNWIWLYVGAFAYAQQKPGASNCDILFRHKDEWFDMTPNALIKALPEKPKISPEDIEFIKSGIESLMPPKRQNRERANGCTDKRIAALFSGYAVPVIIDKKGGCTIYEAKKRGTTTNKANAWWVGTVSHETIGLWLKKWDATGKPEPKSGFTGDMLKSWEEIERAAKAWRDYWQRYAASFAKWRQKHPKSRREDFRYNPDVIVHGAENLASVAPSLDAID